MTAADTLIAGPDPAETPRETAVDTDGYVYDVETGEVLGHTSVSEVVRIETRDQAEAALERRSGIDARIHAIRARRDAYLANLAAQEQAEVRRLAWWDIRFGPELVAFARRSLEGGRSRTARFDHGSVAFRRTQPSFQVTDVAAAVAFVEAWAPGLVKRPEPTVTATAVKEAAEAFRRATDGEEEPDLSAFAVVGQPGESVTISTGVSEKAGGSR